MRKNFILWLFVGLFLGWLISCQPTTSPSANSQVEFWTMQLQPQFSSFFNELFSKFTAENTGVEVRWLDVPWSAMESKILTAVSAKTSPDVVNLNPSFASQLATGNAWIDINSKVSPAVKQQYLPKVWQATSIDGKNFGIPWYLTTRITIFNKDLLTKAGVSQPPSTYADLAVVASKVKEKTGKYAFFITFVPGDSAEVLESFVQMGVNLLSSEGKAAFNTNKGKAAFNYWVDLYQTGLLPPEVLTMGHRQAIDSYQSGELALLSSGAEFLKTITDNAPTIAQVSAVAPQITGETGKKNVAVMNLVIPADTDKLNEALKLALFVTNSQNQLAFAKVANVLPSTVEAIDQYIKEIEQQANNTPLEQARKISAMQIKEAEVLIPAMKNLNQLQKIMCENLQAAMLKEKTVEQALNDAELEWNQYSL